MRDVLRTALLLALPAVPNGMYPATIPEALHPSSDRSTPELYKLSKMGTEFVYDVFNCTTQT